MKHMKNAAKLLAVILVLCMVLIPLVSCTKKEQNVNGYCTVVVATDPETVYTVDLDKLGTVDEGLMSIFEYLKANNGFTYESDDTGYGAFLTKVLSLEQGANYNPYIAIYTSVEADCGGTYTDKTYNGTKLGYSLNGASSMIIQADAVYYIELASY